MILPPMVSVLCLPRALIQFSTDQPTAYVVSSVTRFGDFFCTLGDFLKRLATINLPKSHTFLGNFVKVSKSFIFLVKSFLGNFYRHLAIFFWSHWL